MMAPFFRNVLKLVGGSVAGQLLVLAGMPILARLYSPENLGFVQAAVSLISVLIIVSALRLETAIFSVPQADLDDLFRCAWWLCILTAGVFLFLSLIVITLRSQLTTEECMVAVILPVLGLLASWNQLMSYMGLRRHAFGPSSRAKVVQPLFYVLSSIGAGRIQGSSIGLLLADAVGRGTASVYLGRALAFRKGQFARPSWELLRNTVCKNRELAGLGLISSLINAAGSAFTVAMLLSLFGPYEAGQYAMVERMVGMPIGLLAAGISQVFMANLSRALAISDLKSVHAEFRAVLRLQLLTGIPVAFLVFYVAPVLLDFLLGGEWKTAGVYVKALTLLYLCSYVAGPLNMTLTVLGRQRTQLLWDCVRMVITTATWGIIWTMDLRPETALWLYSISAVLAYSTYLVLADRALARLSLTKF
jgi:O-antigen/teichoic acid export membrane protein